MDARYRIAELTRVVYATSRHFNGINSLIMLVYDIKNPPLTLDLLEAQRDAFPPFQKISIYPLALSSSFLVILSFTQGWLPTYALVACLSLIIVLTFFYVREKPKLRGPVSEDKVVFCGKETYLTVISSPQSLAPLHPSVIKTIRSKQDSAIEAYLNQIEVNRAVCGIDEIIIDTYLFGK